MNNYQESKVSMYLGVRDYTSANSTILNSLPNFAINNTTFNNAVTQILAYSELQNFSKTGITKGKNLQKTTLISLTSDVSRKMVAFAKFTNNTILLAEVDYTESNLKRRGDNSLRNAALGIYDRAQANLTSLATYGITSASQTALLNAINAFTVAIPKPRLGIAEKKQTTEQLAALFKTADTALENIDLAVEIIRSTQVNFYSGYKSVRKLVLMGKGSVSLKGMVTDALSGEPIKSVTLKFAPVDTSVNVKALSNSINLVKKTADKGGFMVKTLAEGSYQVVVSKPGYAQQTVTINVSSGEISVLNIQL